MRTAKILALTLLAACAAPGDDSIDPGTDPGEPDAFGAAGTADPAKLAALQTKARGMIRPGTELQIEPRLGVPTFLWARPPVASVSRARWLAAGVARPVVTAARGALTEYAALYGLKDTDIDRAVVSQIHDTGRGPIIVKLKSQVGGVDIFAEEANVVLSRELDPIAISGYLSSPTTPAARSAGLAFQLDATGAAAYALGHLAKTPIDRSQIVAGGGRDGYDVFGVSSAAGIALVDPIRVKRVYFHVPDGLEPAYYVEVSARTGAAPADVIAVDDRSLATTEAYAYVVSAATGAPLFRKNLIAEGTAGGTGEAQALPAGGFTYRVWADPVTGIPNDTPAGNAVHPKVVAAPDGAQSPFVAPSDVSLAFFPFSQGDPWIAPGATETVGNNVDAYLDLFTPDGIGVPQPPADPPTGDFRAQITAAGAFLHTHTPEVNGPLAEGRQGTIQQLFYNINFLHDWYYDAGFNEAGLNAQTDNFGRGGLGNDSIKGEVQDSSGFNNANMNTPADGARPRMQMFVFPSLANHLEITAPAPIAGKNRIGVSMSGPQTINVTQPIVVATFTAAPACTITNAPALVGNIALFDFDNSDGTGCSFVTRLTRLSGTGAAAVIMAYIASNPTAIANITGMNVAITKPVVVVANVVGAAIRAQLTGGATVTGHVFRQADRDGGLDNQIVAHEWFHYASNRLVGNAVGLAGQQAGGMGEGWGDFNAMMITVRADDPATPSNATYNGAYALATYATSGVPFDGSANNGYYFGIRRYPYSTDLTKNPLTFKHIQNGVPLPVGPPVAFGADGASNAEVHNTGEVWTSMMWECYAGILRDTLGAAPRLTFQQAQDRMKSYLIAGLKITPSFPTITEARDAVLAAMLATDTSDYVACRRAFAKRGAGPHAVGPDRFSTTNTPVTEDFTTGPELAFDSATLDDSLGSCDSDGVLDHGEYGQLTVRLRNTGTEALTATTAAIASTSPDVWFPSGTALSFASIAPGAVGSATIRVAYPPTVTGIQQLDFQIQFTDGALTPQTKTVSFRVNTDDVLASSATDSVEGTTTPWTVASLPTPNGPPVPTWARAAITPLSHVWHVDDPNGVSDQTLTSPEVTVDGSGSLSVAFDHSFAFEFDGGGNYDGGVVEVSINNGPFANLDATPYNGTILAGGVNPLNGRAGFVQSSAGTIHTVMTQAIAAGSKVRVRFRFGSDVGIGAGGWNVDNIAFTGITETPFPVLEADDDTCTLVPTSVDLAVTVTDGVTQAIAGSSVTYTIVASNLGGGDVIGAHVADAFPAGLTCTWTCAASAGSSCTGAGAGAISDTVNLPTGGAVTYTAACAVPLNIATPTLSNTATVANPGPITDPVPANNSATDVDTVVHLPALLTATKLVAGSFVMGGTITYTVAIRNGGTGTQFDNPGNELTDVLPTGLTLVSATATSGTAVATIGTNTVTWNGSLAAGATTTVTITATITAAAGTTISNQGTLSYDGDGNGTNEASGVTEGVPCP